MKRLIVAATILLVIPAMVLAAPAGPIQPWNDKTNDINHESFGKKGSIQLSLAPGDPVNFDAALIAGADYLQGMQADITEDNAGNGNPDVPDDPDDGGWDWSTTTFSHSTSASPKNIYGATGLGLYYAYLETSDAGYFTALTDAADFMKDDSGIRSAGDLVFLMLYNDLPAVSGTAYADSARAKYDGRIATYGTAQAFAEYVRDVRGVSQGYPNGIIAWDIGAFVKAAAMLDARYPGNGYDTDADDMAEVIYQDSYMDNPGLFDIVDDAGWDPTYTDKNFWWYSLGITGLIDAFSASGTHTAEIPGLITILLDCQYSGGGISFCYGANTDDEDWQSTAYAMTSLGNYDQATYQQQINWMGYWIGATQDVSSGGWVYGSGNHYPEIGGECTSGLYFTTNLLADAVVDDDFTSQDAVDVYNTAHGTSYVWGYDAFPTIQEAVDAVNGSTISVQPGTYSAPIFIDKSVDLIGSGATLSFITGGMQIGGSFDGLLIEGFKITGDMAGYKTAVIDSRPTTGPVSNVTVRDCILDGENTASRQCFYGHFITGTWTFDGNEIRNFISWYVADNTGSQHDVPYKIDEVHFVDNWVHGCGGSIAFRGKIDEPMDYAVISGNTMEDYLPTAQSECWAAIEINNVSLLDVFDNTITDVPEVSWGGEGQPLQMWSATPWTVDIHDNDFSGNFQGIYIWTLLLDALWSGPDTPLYIPGGSVYHNNLGGCTDFGVWISDLPIGSGTSSGIGGPLDAEENWWGSVSYGTISAYVSANVDFDPWCTDETHANCTLTYPVTEVWVDDDWAGTPIGAIVDGHVFGYDAFATVQDGVDGVYASTVNIAPGTYVEQVHITTDNMNIIGSGVDVTIIQSPASLTELFVTGSYNNYPIVFVDGATNTSITALTIDGNGVGNANYRFVGLAYWNGDGSFTDAKVINVWDTPFSGAQHGVGVYSQNNTGGPYTITMTDVLVEDFQKTAVALGGGGMMVDLDNVTTIGEGATSVTAQNGIQISPGVSGTLDNCTMSDVAYTGGTWTASGFLNWGNVTATGLDIDGCQTSVYWSDGSGTFTGGTITNPLGDGFYAYNSSAKGTEPKLKPHPIDPAPSSSKAAMSVTLSNTTITGTGAEYSWGVGAFSTSTDAVNLTVTGCVIDNWDYGIYAYDYGSPVVCTVNDNSVTNCTYGMGASATLTNTQDASGNYWGATAYGTVGTLFEGPVDYTPWIGGGTVTGTGFAGDFSTLYADDDSPQAGTESRLIEAIGLVTASTIYLAPGTYPEGPQVHVDKNVEVIGDDRTTVTITPTASTGTSGDARGWFLVDDAVTFDMSDVTLDGSGYNIYQGIRSRGGGEFNRVNFHNLLYPTYYGLAVVVFGNYNVTIADCDFANIGRVGALLYGPGLTNSFFTGNTYTGKGDGDWLDYAADISAGAVVTVTDNVITNCTGVASSDGSTSAGLLVTTYYGAGTTLDIEGNKLAGCDVGLAIGYDDADASTVNVTNGNLFLNNDVGISTTASSGISLTVYGNAFNNTVNAQDDAGGTWDDGASVGNCWSDFGTNSGYPTQYNVPGAAGSVDNYPNTDCILDLTPDDILYHCTASGNFTFDASIGEAVTSMKVASFKFEYDRDLVVVSVSTALGDATIQQQVVGSSATRTKDTLFVDVGILSEDPLDGPATLFTVEMNGTTDYCTGTPIDMYYALLKDVNDDPITTSVPMPINLVADCDDPEVWVNGPAEDGYYNSAPVLDIAANDNCDLDDLYYQIDGCEGSWLAIATDLTGTSYSDASWTLPDFAGLSEGEHCVYFRITDDATRENFDKCDADSAWCFIKDTEDPEPPENFTALPSHNKVKLSWDASPSGDVIGYQIQRTSWGDYPEYNSSAPPYPANQSAGTTVYDGFDLSHDDTYNLNNGTRDIYYYAIFAYDNAGNYSTAVVPPTPGTGTLDRSTSYWLGDIAGGLPPTHGDFDGFVYFADLDYFTLTYFLAEGDAGFDPHSDIGPAAVGSAGSGPGKAKGIPEPDDVIDINDLFIFATNFNTVDDTKRKSVPIFVGQPSSATGLRIVEKIDDHRLHVQIFLDNASDEVKLLESRIAFDSELLAYVGTQQAMQLSDSHVRTFFHSALQGGEVVVTAGALGSDVTFEGSGQVAEIVFTFLTERITHASLSEARLIDANGKDIEFDIPSTEPVAMDDVQLSYSVTQNSPNPFNPTTAIAYSVPVDTRVSIKIYNVVGQLVRTLVDEYKQAGRHTVTWHGTDDSGESVASGVYFYRFETADYQKTVKMSLVK